MDKVVWRFVWAMVCFTMFLYLGLDKAWFSEHVAVGLIIFIGVPLITFLVAYLDLRNEYIAL